MPKSSPRRNAAEGENRRFWKGNTGKSGFPWRGIRVFFGNGREPADGTRSLIASKCKKPAQPQEVERAR
jgi:hypothetical protein